MIQIYPDFESLSRGAAELFAQLTEASIEVRSRFSVALAGGNTPRRTYELLAQNPFRDRIRWDKAHIFWGDERCVPQDDPRSNALMAKQALLDRVPVPSGRIHPMECAESPRDASRRYESMLRAFFDRGQPGFDIVLLGLGEDGHTASLFPFTPVLGEQELWVSEVHPAGQVTRMTITAPLINQSRAVVFIVSSESKARVLREVLEGPRDPLRLPSQLIQPEFHGGGLYWLADRPAASLLSCKTEPLCNSTPRGAVG
jgi:6-phosphogluconolactonase